MSLVVMQTGGVLMLRKILNQNLSLKLYANNYTPVYTSTLGNFTEVSGGGYAAKTLTYANWTFTNGNPSYALYPYQEFSFTGTTGGTGLIYGYYVLDATGAILYAEVISASGFTPVAGSRIRVTPRLEA